MNKLLKFATNQRLVGLACLLLAAAYVHFIEQIPLDFWSETEPFNARSMPYLYGYGAMIIATLLILVPGKSFQWSALKGLKYAPALGLLLLLVFFALTIDYLGFVATSSVFLFAGFVILGERHWLKAVITALGMSLVFYFGLSALDIYLSPGEWWPEHA
jgi:putative tricarboxylic transport membrane protein